ncbi:BTAD domain-containing putative transcriptional regulator [Streptomyces griseus]|uniref:AfsR/SARP family transcriptional regulator n=1 Tax=Streptomyces griseus TaxID=1911 RepID=UPI003792C91B
MHFTLLGSVSAETGARVVALDGNKQRTVFAALLLAHGKVVTDERLIRFVWGWDPPASSVNQLYTYVSRLRTRLGDGVRLERGGPGYRLDIGDSTVDWEAFRELADAGGAELRAGRYAEAERGLAAALALWRGPALTGVTEQLAGAEAPRMEEARLCAEEHRTEAALALGRHTETVAGLTRQVALHPLREGMRGQLMTALYRCGRQAEALALYEAGRRALAEELGIDPGPALRGLYEEILRGALPAPPAPERVRSVLADPVREAGPPPEGAGATGLVPSLLPAAPGDFTGRAAEVEAVLAALSERRDVVVTGAPGTGKSALALYAAERCRDAFPDGSLYADLRTGSGARRPGEVLGWFLRALGADPDRLPGTLDERVQLYRTLLTGRRALVVLDNVTDDAQVRPLLPGGGPSRTVVTGVRAPLASLEGTRVVQLGALGPADAVRLLTAIVGPARIAEDPEAVVRIAEFCDRLPLALRIAAARLVARPQWSTTRLAGRLAHGHRRLAELRLGSLDVAAGLRHAVDGLPVRLAEAFVELASAGPPQLGVPDAAVLLGTGWEEAEEVLEELTDARLAEGWSAGADRRPCYRFPSLVRLFAQELRGASLAVA